MASRVFVLLTFAGTALLAACGGGGGGITPSSSTTPTPAPSASATATPTPASTATPTPAGTATPTPAAAVFSGGSKTVTFTSSGGSFSLSPADNTYTATVAFGSNNATAPFSFTMSWASPYSQITGTFAPGPLPATIGSALFYLDFKPAVSVGFNQTPAFTVTTTGTFPGTKCDFAVYGTPGSGGGGTQSWFSGSAVGVAEVSPSGSTFTVAAQTLVGATVDFGTNDTYIAAYCH